METSYEFGPVTRLVGRYCDAVARFDLDLFEAIWAEDAIWYLAGRNDRHGRGEIVELFRNARARFDLCIQEILSSVIDPTGKARSYVRELQWRKDGETSQLIGIYDDTVSGPAEDPLFASRRFTPLYRGPIDLSGERFDPSNLDSA